MSKKSIILVVAFFTLLVVGMFVYAYMKNSEINDIPVIDEQKVTPVVDPYAQITRIDARHYFIDGKHTFVGEIILPTPCDLVDTETIIMESYPEQVVIDFKIINNSKSCVEQSVSQRFRVDVEVSSDALFKARLQGRDVDFNLVPAADNEVPDDFELFIKG